MAQSLVTIRNTFIRNEQFLIPDYQRGYKWTVAEVRKLLEDINSFKVSGGLKYYCLQNLTLVQSVDKQIYKVVDGQQRLTTCSIILSYLKYRKKEDGNSDIGDIPSLKNGDVGNLSFGNRKEKTTQPFFDAEILDGKIWSDKQFSKCQVWLSNVDESGERSQNLYCLFDNWLADKDRDKYDHSDIYHMFCAAMTVAAFFNASDKQGNLVCIREFATKFLHEVCFLLNIVAEDSSAVTSGRDKKAVLEAEIFSKINGFRVPLDGADLLRAIFITYAVDENVIGGGPMEHEVRLNESRVKLGLELDEMSAWWHDKRHQKYFAMFDPYNNQQGSAFDSVRYPINILYRLFSVTKGVKFITVDWFEHYDGGIPKLYCEIRRFHSVLKDWYEDVKLYHFAGFLVGQCSAKFSKIDPSNHQHGIYELLGRIKKRSVLFKELKKKMLIAITKPMESEDEQESVSEPNLQELAKRLADFKKAIDGTTPHNWYEEYPFSVKQLLTLMDVISFAEADCVQADPPKEKNGEVKDKRTDEKDKPSSLANHLAPEFFTCAGEDKEHIFPQTPIGGKDRKNSANLQKKMEQYWELVVDTISKDKKDCSKDDIKKDLISQWNQYWCNCESQMKLSENNEIIPLTFEDKGTAQKWIDWLFAKEGRDEETIRRINQFVMDQCRIDLNSVGNIVMLDAGINRGYGNKFFTEKRKEIWAKFRACRPVRLHTYRVFAKEFDDDGLGDVWGQQSIVNNRVAIKIGIDKFFNELFR